jgi:hypothetical protein
MRLSANSKVMIIISAFKDNRSATKNYKFAVGLLP